MSRPCKCYALQYGGGPLEPFVIQRREPISTDVVVEIKYAGICHSDIHTGRLEWGDRPFPLVPGHEMGTINSLQAN